MNVLRNKKRKKRKYSVNDHYLNKENHQMFWFLGLMAADGNISSTRNFSISQSSNAGRDMIEHIRGMLQFEGNIYNIKNAHAMYFTSEKLVDKLNSYGIFRNKTLTFVFPDISPEYDKSFLRGYFEGDGSVGVYDNGFDIKYLCTSLVGTKSFIKSCSEKIPIKGKIREIKRCENLYELRWHGKKAIAFCKWLFSNKRLYKGKKYKIIENYLKDRDDQFTKYAPLRKKAKELYEQNYNCMQIAKKIDMPFQTIYKWKDKGFR